METSKLSAAGEPLRAWRSMSRSLESVLGGQRPQAHTVGLVRVDQQGRLVPSVMAARSVVMQQDPRRFSEASIIPPPRPPPPNLKRLNMKPQRRPTVHPAAPGTPWPPQVVPSPPTQTQPQPQPQPQPQHQPLQGAGGSNLVKMTNLARSTPQLDEQADSRERERIRERDKSPHVQNTRDSLIAQVMEAVHGVTTEEVQTALQRNDWNPVRAGQQLKLEQLYSLSLCSKEDCLRILSRHQWNLQLASRYLIRWSREDRTGPGERERPQVSTERRV